MQIQNKKMIFLAILLLAVLAAACSPAANQTPTLDPAAVYTQVAATVQAGILQTQAAMPSPTATLTNTPTPTLAVSPTGTLSTTVLPTSGTAMPSLTPYVPSAGGTPASATGDNLKWVADVSIPDCTILPPGTEVTKTWKVQNNGTTTWTKDYYALWTDIKNYDIYKYTDVVIQVQKKLGEEIKPGAEYELDMKLVTPVTNGVYKVFYTMINPNVKYPTGHLGFGDPLWVTFVINDTPSSPITCP